MLQCFQDVCRRFTADMAVARFLYYYCDINDENVVRDTFLFTSPQRLATSSSFWLDVVVWLLDCVVVAASSSSSSFAPLVHAWHRADVLAMES